MNHLYKELIDPDLYFDDSVAKFIENLLEPEIDSQSDENAEEFIEKMIPTDDIESLSESIYKQSKVSILDTGSLIPSFIIFRSQNNSIKLKADIPCKKNQVRDFSTAAKALAFIQNAQCVFFRTLQPIEENGNLIFGREIETDTAWAVHQVGSSVRGNCFVLLADIIRSNKNEVNFHITTQQILREGKYDYPYSRFFHIDDEIEMASVIQQIPRLVAKFPGLTEKDCLINFATTLKALCYFGYDK